MNAPENSPEKDPVNPVQNADDEALLSPLAQVIDALDEENIEQVNEVINDLKPAEIARILESLPPSEREQVWEEVDDAFNADVLAHVGEQALETLLEDMSEEELRRAIIGMDNDDLVDFLQNVPDSVKNRLMQSLDAKKQETLSQMLEYPEHSAGGMMNTDTITVRADSTVDAVLRYLHRWRALPSSTSKVFVVTRNMDLQGEITLGQLITAAGEAKIGDVMRDSVVFHVLDNSDVIARQFREHDLVSAPVVNEDGQLVGRITVDDVIDYLQDETERLLMSHAGMDEEEDTFAPIEQAAKHRGIWLGINLVTAFLAAGVINAFGATIEKVVALAALAPIIASMGGIAGSQSLTIIIRGIALGQIESSNAWALLLREVLIGVINGLVWGLVTALVAYFWFGRLNLALIVVCAIFINLLCAALSGVGIPLLLKKMGIDPALAGSVILTTVTDVMGFLVLLGLATLIV